VKAFTIHRKAVLFIVVLLWATPLFAHTINYELENAPLHNVVGFYMKLGIEHILPNGLDHILFVVGLCLLSTRVKTILWQATAFTVAHSITLALSMKGVVTLPSAIVEPIIALSILFVAVENLLLQELKAWRIVVVFLFGLIHGLGFASALNEIGLPRNQFLTSIFSFNVGVEIGQVIVIALVFGLIIHPFGKKRSYRKWLVLPLSTIIAVVALWWTIERI
jgi:hydrogenase/urease accessory protein HupE